MEGLFGFILAGFALVASPGPATLSLAAIGAAFGARRGLGYMVGIAVGMIIVMSIIATGVSVIILAIPGVTPIVTALGAAYIVYLAYRIGTAPPLTEPTHHHRQPSFIGGVILSLSIRSRTRFWRRYSPALSWWKTPFIWTLRSRWSFC